MDAVGQARSGHVGLPLGCAEMAAVLFAEYLRHDPAHPEWADRDRFVLSGGHGSMLLYSLLHLSGYAVAIDQIRSFRQLHSITPGHPEYGMTPGVETTTGPLGQGFGNAVGMALAERILSARFGSGLVDHRTFVLASDGDLMEGVASEAASLAGHLGLGAWSFSTMTTASRSTAPPVWPSPRTWLAASKPMAGTSRKSTATILRRCGRRWTRLRGPRTVPT